MQQALVDATPPRAVTLESEKPDLLNTLKRAGKVPSEAELAPYWAGFVRLQKAEWNATMNTACRRIAHNQQLVMMAPILPPAYTTDIGTGAFSGHRMDITEGLSIFRLRPGNSPNRKAYRKQSKAYTIVGLGTGAAQEDVVQMLMDNKDVELPESSEQFRGFLEGQYVLMLAFVRSHNRLVQSYDEHIMQQRMEIIEMIELEYNKPIQRRTVWVIIMACIHRTFRDYLTQLERHPPPMVAGGPAPSMPKEAASFYDVYDFLSHGRVEFLTKIPECLLADRTREDTPQLRPNTGDKSPTSPMNPSSCDKNKMPKKDQWPDQNPNLKKAWAATGKNNVFGSDSPFYDPSSPNNKVVIMSDTPGM